MLTAASPGVGSKLPQHPLAGEMVNYALGAQRDFQLAASVPPEVREAVTYGRPTAGRDLLK